MITINDPPITAKKVPLSLVDSAFATSPHALISFSNAIFKYKKLNKILNTFPAVILLDEVQHRNDRPA